MRRVWIGTAVLIAVTLVLELSYRHLAHAEYWWHSLPGFDFAYGFLSCVVIVFGSKWIGHTFLQRDENYYEREE